MGAVDTTYTFTATDTITSTKMNNIIDQTTITSDAVSGTTLEVVTGKLKVRSQGITSNEMAANSITSTQITAGSITTAKIASDALIAKASTLAESGGNGTAMTFRYTGQGGQPIWAWGTNDGINHYVWNPANFSVSRAGNGPTDGTFVQDHAANVHKMQIGGFNTFGGDHGINFYPSIATAGSPAEACVFFAADRSTVRGSINITGTGVNYASNSDHRLKDDIVSIQDPIGLVNKLNPVNFRWIEDGSRSDGFIAHEVQSVIPNAVTGYKNAIEPDGKPIYQKLEQSKLIPIMVAAIQQLSQKVSELESR